MTAAAAGMHPGPAASRDDPGHPEAGYRERARLVAYLAAQHEAHWATPNPADPYAAAFRVVCVHTPDGQPMTWHVHPGDEALFPALPTRASDYDGHTTAEKYARLAALGDAAAASRRAAAGAHGQLVLDATRAELARADGKATALLGVAGTIVGVGLAALLAGAWAPSQLPPAARVAWWVGVAAAATGLALLAAIITPGRETSTNAGDGYIGYYGDVARLAGGGRGALVAALAASASAGVGVIATELDECSRLVKRKYRMIRAGVGSLAGAGAALALAALLGTAP